MLIPKTDYFLNYVFIPLGKEILRTNQKLIFG